jgi:uncharacterized protein YjbJ (UPF0337 family)
VRSEGEQNEGQRQKGSVKQAVGHVTGNPKVEAEGQQEKIEGKVQKKIGQVERVIDK